MDDATPSATSLYTRVKKMPHGKAGEERRGEEKKERARGTGKRKGRGREGGRIIGSASKMRKEQEQRGKGAGAPIPPLPLQAAKSRIEQSRVGWSRVE